MTTRSASIAQLKIQAENIWLNVTFRGSVRPTSKQRDIMTLAYHANVLPTDSDYSVHEWVERNFPEIV